jgi:hypothetical protein
MAAVAAPALYNLSMTPNKQALLPEDAHRVLYDLYLGIYTLCALLDEDAGTLSNDYATKIGDSLGSGCSFPGYPLGTATGTYFYTPSKRMDPNGMDTVDIYTAVFDLAISLIILCDHLVVDTGGNPSSDYGSTNGDYLTSTLGAKMAAPKQGNLYSTSPYYVLEGYIANGAYTMGDLYKSLYNLYIALVAICDMLDADSGVALGTDYLATVGTPLKAAMGGFIRAPKGPTTTGT